MVRYVGGQVTSHKCHDGGYVGMGETLSKAFASNGTTCASDEDLHLRKDGDDDFGRVKQAE